VNRLVRCLVCVVAISTASPSWAAPWPERPVRLVVAAPAGSSIDALARAIGERLKDRIGQPVVIENKAAAGGTVATAEVAKAAPDGCTLLLGFNGPPAVIASTQPNVLAVNADLPARSVRELIALAKANPGKLAYASVGNGSASHLDMELFKSIAGFDALHVPFNGSPPAVMATIQNETQMLFAVMQPLKAQIDAGRLRPLAVTSAQRFALLPDLPTIAESGYPGFEALAWNGVMVPSHTPKPVVARLNAEINAILKEADVIDKMHAVGFELIGGTSEAFGALIARETATWAPVVRRLGLRVD